MEKDSEKASTKTDLLKAGPVAALEGELHDRVSRILDAILHGLLKIWFFMFVFWVTFQLFRPSQGADETEKYSPMCMHSIGGGPVGPRGSLLHYDPLCTQQLKDYFAKAYYAEVHRVADEAIAYYRQQIAQQPKSEEAVGVTSASYRGTVVFDIDETALSNADGFFDEDPLTRLWHRLFGRADSSETRCARPHLDFVRQPAMQQSSQVRPEGGPVVQQQGGVAAGTGSMEQVVGGVAELLPRPQQVQQRAPLCSAPALESVRDLYNFLLDSNYTVVFLTGRSEDARQETEDNLEAAGYGRQCGQEEQKLLPAPHHRRLLRTPAQPQPGGPRRCYSALLMRREGDTRLASVFKPEARQQLLAAAAGGVVLAGSIGDQFSDLVGMPVAEANWKLPNPVYTLL